MPHSSRTPTALDSSKPRACSVVWIKLVSPEDIECAGFYLPKCMLPNTKTCLHFFRLSAAIVSSVPDAQWKDGARNTTGGDSGGRRVGHENMLLKHGSAKRRNNRYAKCRFVLDPQDERNVCILRPSLAQDTRTQDTGR